MLKLTNKVMALLVQTRIIPVMLILIKAGFVITWKTIQGHYSVSIRANSEGTGMEYAMVNAVLQCKETDPVEEVNY